MPPEVPRIGQRSTNTPPGLPGSGPNRYDQPRGGGNGRGQRQEPAPEEAAPEAAAPEPAEPGLESDTFSGRRNALSAGRFLETKMPWELEAEEKERQLAAKRAELRQRGGGTGPLSQMAAQRNPKAATGPLSAGRGVDSAYDPNAAVNNTLAAHQTLRERQAERLRQAQQQASQPGAAPGQPLHAPGPTAHVPDLFAPSGGEPLIPDLFGPASDAPLFPDLSAPRDALPPATPLASPERPAGAKAAPPSPAEAWEATTTVPAVEPPAPASNAGLEDGVPPLAEAAGRPTKQLKPDRCSYWILDAAKGTPLAQARLEFEPAENAHLASVNGQADFEGNYHNKTIPPGTYRITVRHPGYIPYSETRTIGLQETDMATFSLRKP